MGHLQEKLELFSTTDQRLFGLGDYLDSLTDQCAIVPTAPPSPRQLSHRSQIRCLNSLDGKGATIKYLLNPHPQPDSS